MKEKNKESIYIYKGAEILNTYEAKEGLGLIRFSGG